MNKKSQLRIQEMAFMLVAVVLFFVLVGLFALMIFQNSLYEEVTEVAEKRTLSAVTNLADSPEFSCVDISSNCMDGDKLMALIGKKNYEDFWHFSSLSVLRFRAFNKSESDMITCTLANYPECDKFMVYDKNVRDERTISSFAALCITEYEQEHYKKCEIAKILAGTEQIIPGVE